MLPGYFLDETSIRHYECNEFNYERKSVCSFKFIKSI